MIKLWLAGLTVLAAMTALAPGCDLRRGTVASPPGETPEELEAAGEVLDAVGDSVPLVEVRLSTESGTTERRAVGVVIGEMRRVLVAAEAISLEVGDGDQTRIAHTRSIQAVFHPGGENEQRWPATVVREGPERRIALLSLESNSPPAVPLGDDVPDEARAFLISIPLNMSALVVEAGRVRGYRDRRAGRVLVHTAGREPGSGGPVVNEDAELIGLQLPDGDEERTAIPAVEISRWLLTPDPEEQLPSEPGRVVGRLLRQMDVHHVPSNSGGGYLLPHAATSGLLVRQTEGIISAQANVVSLHVGDAIEALRFNYSDPVGAIALKPAGAVEQPIWVARIPADAADAPYLSKITRMATLQVERWRQLASGLTPEYPYEHYPGGDEDAQFDQLSEIVREATTPYDVDDESFELDPEAAVSVFVNIFRGMAYVHAYSGGMPGEDAAQQEQIARQLLHRNWELPLGRLALDEHRDLAWEAQVPIEHLTPEYLDALVRVCQDEVTRIETKYGDIPFNEQ